MRFAAALALLAATPFAEADLATADAVDMEIAEIGTLTPGRAVVANLTIRYCAGSGPVPAAPREVTLAARGPPWWLAVNFEPPSHAFAVVFPGECSEGRGFMRLNATRGAPAWELGNFSVEAAPRDGGIAARVAYVFKVGFFGDLSVTPPPPRLRAEAGEVTSFAVRVENRGNAETKFLATIPGTVPGLQVVLPGPLVLAPGESRPWEIGVAPSGAGGRSLPLNVYVTSHAFHDHRALGGSAVLHVEVDAIADALGRGAPGPHALVAVAAIALVARATFPRDCRMSAESASARAKSL